MLREFIKQKYIKVGKLVKPGSKVLDIGCNKAEILDFLPNVDYYGVDVNKEVIKELKQKKLKIYYADLNKDEIKIKTKFDYVLLLDVLEHIVNPKQIIENSKKLLNPNGFLIVSLPNDYHFLNKLRFLFNKELFESFKPTGHLHIFPIKKGKKFLQDNNLTIIKEIELPATEPRIIPNFIKNMLSRLFPNNFARGILYLTKVNYKE